MIISRHSGNAIGYLDYYANSAIRVNVISALSRLQKVKLDQQSALNLEGAYKVREVIVDKKNGQIRKCQEISRQSDIYTSKGECSWVYQVGDLINIII